MNKEKNNNEEEFSKEIIDLVIARLRAIPSDASLSVGEEGGVFGIEELIKRVKAKDEIGKQIIEAQLYFLRSLKDLPIEENVFVNNQTSIR